MTHTVEGWAVTTQCGKDFIGNPTRIFLRQNSQLMLFPTRAQAREFRKLFYLVKPRIVRVRQTTEVIDE